MKYKIQFSKQFKKVFKKLENKDKDQVLHILERLANDEKLEPKYKDHKLKGGYEGFKECHILPDLLLIYQKYEDLLILSAFRLGSHSELF